MIQCRSQGRGLGVGPPHFLNPKVKTDIYKMLKINLTSESYYTTFCCENDKLLYGKR